MRLIANFNGFLAFKLKEDLFGHKALIMTLNFYFCHSFNT